MKFETKLNKLGVNEEEVKSIIANCECGEINGAYFIDLTKEKKEFIMEVVGNYLDDDSEEFEGWTDIKRIATFCKTFDISEDEIPNYYRLGFNEGGEDIAYELESNKDVLLVLTDDERYHNSFIKYSPSQQSEEETEEEIRFVAKYNGGDTYILDTKEQADLEMENACNLINHTLNEKRFVCKTLSNGIVLLKDNNVRRLLNVFETADFLNSLDCTYYDDESEENWVSFKIVSKNDDRIYIAGQFDVNSYDEDTDMGDWEYEQNDGSYESHLPRYWKVDGESLSFEYGAFIDCIDWDIFRQYLFEFADENKSIDCGVYLLHINNGATMECEIEEPATYRGDWIVEVIPKFNGDKIDLVTYMVETNEEFNPYDVNDFCFEIEDGHIYFEISKDYFEDDEIDSNMKLINEEARRIFARSITYELGVYAQYGENVEQSLDDSYDNNWLFKLSLLDDDNLKDFLKEEGIIEG